VPVRVSPTDKIRGEMDALFGCGRDLAEILEDVARLGARLIMQSALEAEVEAFLGRARYQRRADAPDARAGSRNGYCPTTVKTTAGPVTVDRPKLRGTDEKFVSRLFGAAVTKTHALETLVIAGFVRGLSVRDVEAALADALGPQAALSKSTVSRVCQAIRDEFDAWRTRRLDDVELDYLFVDGSHFKMHQGSRAEPVLAAWGITTAGKPVLVGLDAAGNEGNDAWDEFLDGLKARGLRPPLLVISDGAAGLVGRSTARWPGRCVNAVWFTDAAMFWPRYPPKRRPTSRPPTGRSSTCHPRSNRARRPKPLSGNVFKPSLPPITARTRPRCAASNRTSRR